MALVLADRVQQTGTANTTVSFTLSGSVTGYQSFAVVGNGNTTYYAATDGSGNWEVGIGTYSTTGPTLTRTTILSSSNSGSAVTFPGTVNVFVTYPSEKSVNLDGSGNVTVGNNLTVAGTSTFTGGLTGTSASFSTLSGTLDGSNLINTSVSNTKLAFDAGSYSRRNKIINCGFDVWQLGTYFTVSTHLQKLADRWNFDWNGTVGTLIIQKVFNPSLGDVRSAVRITNTGGASGNTFYDFSTQLESVRTLQNRTVTISFYALSASANNQITVKTEQYFGSGGSPSSSVFNTSSAIPVSTSAWTRYSVTFTMASVIGKTLGSNGDDTLNVIFTLPLNQTFDLYISGVQIEEGSVPTPLDLPSPAETYADCQRYLQTSYPEGTSVGTVTSEGILAFIQSGASSLQTIQTKTPMRVLPAITYYNPVTGAAGTWNGAGTALTVSTNTNGVKNVSVSISGGTAGVFCSGHYVLQDPYY